MANGNNRYYDERVFENVGSLTAKLSYIAARIKRNIPKYGK